MQMRFQTLIIAIASTMSVSSFSLEERGSSIPDRVVDAVLAEHGDRLGQREGSALAVE